MPHPALNPLTLGALYAIGMAKAYLRYRNPRRREADGHRVAFYDRAWRDAAQSVGATWAPIGAGISEITMGDFRTRVIENTCAIDDPVTLAVLADKPLTHRIVRGESVPVPPHVTFTTRTIAPAADFLRHTAGDCVVKPACGTGGGRGITTGIRTPWQLARAAALASVYGERLLIEEQVPGDNYRLLYLDGELVDAFVRRPPTVVGDGRSTVSKLVAEANAERLRQGSGRSQVLLTVDMDVRRTLARQGLSLRSVPPAGASVVLKTVVNENAGDDNSGAIGVLCDSIVEDCARVVRALGVRLAGVDVITRNPKVPLAESGGVVLEVNAPPNFYYHYHKRDGAFPVAVHVLTRLLAGHRAAETEVARAD